MLKKRCAISTLLFLALKSSAQLMPVYNVPSPEVAGLGMYGSIPVGHYTGIPEITVPVYEVKTGKYTLPISASYHLASVKPDSQYGPLGLGWSLSAGGYITRSVCLFQDEKYYSEELKGGYYYWASVMENITNSNYLSAVNECEVDLSADEFSFNFCGYSGYFYYNQHNGWTVVSDDDIKVLFDEQNDGIITNTNSLLRQRIYMQNWANYNANKHYFNKFTLVTPDGAQYEFGGVNATEYSISYYNRDHSDLIPTTWRLSKITTTDGRIIRFTYRTDGILCDLRYMPQQLSFNAEFNVGIWSHDWVTDGEATIVKGINAFTGFLIFPVYLKEITTENETISFKYTEDYQYGSRFLHDPRVIYFESASADHYDIHGYGKFNPTNQYFSLLQIGKLPTVVQNQNQIVDQLKCLLLKSVSVKKNYGRNALEVHFNYYGSSRPKLSSITHEGSLIMGNDTTISTKRYRFNYNLTSVMPSYFVYPATDSWGYYLGNDIVITNTPSFSLVLPNINATKSETLSEIIYPTGGRTQFGYELNTYSKVVNDNHIGLRSESGMAGGLRVALIKDIDENGHLVRQKKYFYRENISGGSSSGILKAKPSFEVKVNLPNHYSTYRNAHFVHKSQGGFWPSSNRENSPSVGYSSVIEELIGNDGVTQGYIRYRYSNYDNDVYGVAHGNDSAFYFTSPEGDYYGVASPYASKSVERGKLQSVEYFAANGVDLVKKINYRYTATAEPSMVTSFQNWIVFHYQGEKFIVPLGWLTNTPTYSYLKSAETDTIYSTEGGAPFNTSRTFGYNSYKLPTTITESTSTGSNRTTVLSYPSDFSAYSWMTARHILNPIVQQTISEQSRSLSDLYGYSCSNGVPYIQTYKQLFNGNNQKTLFTVNVVDEYGNPLEYEANGMKSVLFWGRNGQLLLGKIDNISYQEALELTDAYYESTNPAECYGIEHGYMYMPSTAHLHAYGYNGDNQLQTVMAPTGFMTYYKYDGLGRLRETYHYDDAAEGVLKRVLDVYDYQYSYE